MLNEGFHGSREIFVLMINQPELPPEFSIGQEDTLQNAPLKVLGNQSKRQD